MVSTNSGDDSIDFADGWNGTGTYWYISGGAKAGIEGSNNGDNGNATPETKATLKNITVVGPVKEGALYFKEGGGTVTIENFYIYGVDKGVKVKSKDKEAIARIDAGKLKMSNVQFDNKLDGYHYNIHCVLISDEKPVQWTSWTLLIKEKDYLMSVLKEGADNAQRIAYKVLAKVYRKSGLVAPK